jgi:hypothetical protein
MRSRDYWATYKAQFDSHGRSLSLQEVLRKFMTGTESNDQMQTLPAAEKEDGDDET